MRYHDYNSSNLLQDAFNVYRSNNLVRSQTAFSHRILGRKSSYYSSMIARNRRPSQRVLETLMNVTKTIMATFLGNPHFGKLYAENLNRAYEELQQLVEQISVEISFLQAVDQLADQVDNLGM
jgi:hypothetical protein